MCVASKTSPFTLAVCVLGLHLRMKLNPVISGSYWKFPSNIGLLTIMDVILSYQKCVSLSIVIQKMLKKSLSVLS